MSCAAIIVARLSSTRLPGKPLFFIKGKTVLDHILVRLNNTGIFDRIVLATTIESVDDQLERWASCRGIKCYRGSLYNVAERFCMAALSTDFHLFYRANGDSPFPSVRYIVDSLTQIKESRYEFLTGKSQYTGLPPGSLGEWVTRKALQRLATEDLNNLEKEHITARIMSSNSYSWSYFVPSKVINHANKSLTLDTIEDYEKFIRMSSLPTML